MRRAGAIVADTLAFLQAKVRPGISTKDLDDWARQEIHRLGGRPSFPDVVHPRLGTHYPGAICTSVNDEIVHGIPSPDRILVEGDIVGVDVGVIYRGLHADSAATFPVGKIAVQTQKLLDVTQEALRLGIERVQPGGRLYEVGAAIERYADSKGLTVVKQYVGHGIGREMHQPPQVPNHQQDKRSPIMRPGWGLAIEPMLNLGGEDTKVLSDGWTVATLDGSISAHFEHTVAVTPKGPWILTMPDGATNGNMRQ